MEGEWGVGEGRFGGGVGGLRAGGGMLGADREMNERGQTKGKWR